MLAFVSGATRPSSGLAIAADVDATGDMIVFGTAEIPTSAAPKPALAEINSTGTLVTTFRGAGNGFVVGALNGNITGAVYSGKPVAAGYAGGSGTVIRYDFAPSLTNIPRFTGVNVDSMGNVAAVALSSDSQSIVLARSDSTGAGTAPIFTTGLGSVAINVLSLPDAGAIVGVITPTGASAVARFGANTLDPSFGEGGVVAASMSSQPTYLTTNIAKQCDDTSSYLVAAATQVRMAQREAARRRSRVSTPTAPSTRPSEKVEPRAPSPTFMRHAVLTDSRGHLLVVGKWLTTPPETSLMRFSQ